ncbi:MAG TPA: phosphopantothenoylcysteine decarboxylase [Rectinemataceae bacterium]|nr:phosphopantothenoylcysteine decarboxylase [Rectinemataceae bacterium]
MDIIITAGGTRERIDEVRSITNEATGRLGALLTDALLGSGADRIGKMYYVHGRGAAMPLLPGASCVEVGGINDLSSTLEEISRNCRIDAVVHSMAVSDYRVSRATTLRALTDQEPDLDSSGKIGSTLDDLVLVLERAPKVIALLRGWFPGALIVGFKLLSGADDGRLVAAASALLKANDCDYVLANDASALRALTCDGAASSAGASGIATPIAAVHQGLLLSPDGSFERLEGKAAIASRLAHLILAKGEIKP